MAERREGGCLCGAVRYTADWPPLATVVCHCKDCQKQAGSALSVVAVLKRAAITVSGNLSVYEHRGSSGQRVFRQFCRQCGSPVVTDTERAREQGIIFLKAGTLDEAKDLAPTSHYWTKSAQDWFVYPDGVEQLEEQ